MKFYFKQNVINSNFNYFTNSNRIFILHVIDHSTPVRNISYVVVGFLLTTFLFKIFAIYFKIIVTFTITSFMIIVLDYDLFTKLELP